MMNKPAAFIVVEGGQTWLRTSAETEEAIRTGFIMETVPLYTGLPKREPLSDEAICQILLKKEWKGFVDLVRIIEKAHGIGGGE
jgi:hypothetical protein